MEMALLALTALRDVGMHGYLWVLTIGGVLSIERDWLRLNVRLNNSKENFFQKSRMAFLIKTI
jgi:hypothetical protein